MPDFTLEEVVGYGQQQGADPATIAKAVRAWHGSTVQEAREVIPDQEKFWTGTTKVDRTVADTLNSLRNAAQLQTAAKLFPDPQEFQQFSSVLESSGYDPMKMDAPPAWIEAARKLDAAAADPVFAPPRHQYGKIAFGPNKLADYSIRTKEDGVGYEAMVYPSDDEGKPRGAPIRVELPAREVMAQQMEEDVARKKSDLDQLSTIANNPFASGEHAEGVSYMLPALETAYQNAQQSREAITKGTESTALHIGLNNALLNNDAFKATVPQNTLEQFTTRPILGVVRSLAEGGSAATGTGKEDILTTQGHDAMDVLTPGRLRSRWEAHGNAMMAPGDAIESGMESLVSVMLPGGLAKLAGKALPALNAASVAGKAAYGTLGATSYGSNYAGALMEAEAVRKTDPEKADRILRYAQLTSVLKAGIEMATERIFPDEAAVAGMKGMTWKQARTMPLREGAEEFAGAIGQNLVNTIDGQQNQNPLESAWQGALGSLPFIGMGMAQNRISRQRNAAGPAPAVASEGRGMATDATLPTSPTAGSGSIPDVAAPYVQPPNASTADANLPTGPGTVSDTLLTPPTDQDPTGTVPELPATLDEQFRRVKSGTKPGMIFPGLQPEDLPAQYRPSEHDDLVATATPAGTVVHPLDIPRTDVLAAVENNQLGQLLGYGTDAKPTPTEGSPPPVAVTLRTADGTEVDSVAADPADAPAIAAHLQSRAEPGDTVQVETPEDVLKGRLPQEPSAGEVGLMPSESNPEDLVIGDRFKDRKGVEYEVWKHRHGVLTAVPVVDGKPVVNNQSGVRFSTTPYAASRNPDDRIDLLPSAEDLTAAPPDIIDAVQADLVVDTPNAEETGRQPTSSVSPQTLLPASPATGKPRPVAVKPRRYAWKDPNARDFANHPLVEWIRSQGGIVSKATAIKRAKNSDELRAIEGFYDELDPGLGSVHYARHIYSKDGVALDIMANNAYWNPEGSKIKDAHPGTLAQELNAIYKASRRDDAKLSYEETAIMQGTGMNQKEWEAADKIQRRQGDAFTKATKPLTKAGEPRTKLPISQLTEGSTVKLGKERFTVKKLNYDEDGHLVDVEMQDGDKYGIQHVEPGEVHFVESVRIKKPAAAPAPANEDDPFSRPTTTARPSKPLTPETVRSRLQARGLSGRGVRVVSDKSRADEGRLNPDGTIELNAALLSTPADVDRVLDHEVAHLADRDPALQPDIAAMRAAMPALMIAALEQDILSRGYEAGALPSEVVANLVQQLNRQFQQAPAWKQLVAKIKLWAKQKLGIKLTESDAQALAARVLAAGFKAVREGNQRRSLAALPGAVKLRGGGILVPPDQRKAAFSIMAYHGTPHKVDRFSTDFMGTGNGAQAYGWGLYFAEDRTAAEMYRRDLAGEFAVDGKTILKNNKKVGTTGDNTLDDLLMSHGGNIDAAISWAKGGLDEYIPRLEALRGRITASNSGNLYTVDLLPEEGDFLDWDKPLSAQSEKVKAAFREWLRNDPEAYDAIQNQTGGQWYGRWETTAKARFRSETLAKMGIPGIRHLDSLRRTIRTLGITTTDKGFTVHPDGDQDSILGTFSTEQEAIDFIQRTAPDKVEGTYNYVIFDDKLIKILEENGKPVEQGQRPQFSLPPKSNDLHPGPTPATPEYDTRRFGLRVQADERLRDAWRARFTPTLYKTFTEETLRKQIREWIADNGGLEGAASLFLDSTSGLQDFERNALGQQLALSYDLRARRLETSGNVDGMRQAEAALDQIIGTLEGLATQAGQALRAFGMWSKLSPRGITRTVQREAGRRTDAKITENLGAEPADILGAVNAIDPSQSTPEDLQKKQEQLIASLQPKDKKTREKIPRFIRTLLEARRNGALSRADFHDAFARAFGMPRFTPEFAAEIRALAAQVEATPAGSWLRQKAQSALMTRLAQWEGIPAGEIWTAFWYANILSGIGTQAVNLSGNASHLLLKTVTTALSNNPVHTFQFFRGMLSGFTQGLPQAKAAFFHGDPVLKGEEMWQKKDVLEMLWSDNPTTLGRKIAKYGAASWGRYVFRALTAADAVFYNTAKEARAFLELSRTGQAQADPATVLAAQEQAKQDLQTAGATLTPANLDRRTLEILEAQRPAEVLAAARRFGGQATFNYDPEGFLGAIAGGINHAIQRAPILRAAIPFTRIVANLADQGLNWTPVGLARAAAGMHLTDWTLIKLGQKPFGKPFSRRDRIERTLAASIGMATFASLYALAKAHKDDDDDRVEFMIYGGGPTDKNRRAQMPKDWKPYSIKIRDRYYSYAETPLSLLFGALGASMDKQRYGIPKPGDDNTWRKFEMLAAGAGMSFSKTGIMSGLDNLQNIINGNSNPETFMARTASGFIPAQGLLRDIAKLMDDSKVNTSTIEGVVLQNLPYLRSKTGKALNVFGDPVREPGPWILSRLTTKLDRADKDAVWLTQNKLHIPDLDQELVIGKYLSKEEIYAAKHRAPLAGERAQLIANLKAGYLTEDQRVQFLKTSGPLIRQSLQSLQRIPPGLDPKTMQSKINTATKAAREIAMRKLIGL